MPTFGMTDHGFVPKRLADILESITTRVKNIQDPRTGEYPFINESADTLFGQMSQIFSEELSICWEAAYQASNQFNPISAKGSSLRSLVQINGITPSYGARTEVLMTLGGKAGTFIPEGSMIANSNGTETYTTVAGVTIPASGTVNVNAVCVSTGPNNPSANTIISIQTPVAGWSTATNVSTVSIGDYEDTDSDLHVKQQRATSETAYRQVDAIVAGILTVDGVKFARCYVNKTVTTDEKGIGGKTLAPVVVGGTDEDVANALRLKMGATDDTQGNLTNPVQFVGELGDVQTIDFYRPTEVPIYVKVDIVVTDASQWSEGYVDAIKEAIVQYAQYDQTGKYGFPPGCSVVRSRLYTPVNEFPGFSVTNLKIGKTSTTSNNDITINWNEIADFNVSRITVNASTP